MRPSPSEFSIGEPLIMFYVTNALNDDRPDIYEAVRGWWKIDPEKAKNYKLVLARDKERIVGAFRPRQWRQSQDRAGRWEFDGVTAELPVQIRYVGKRVPAQYLGGRSPFRYLEPED